MTQDLLQIVSANLGGNRHNVKPRRNLEQLAKKMKSMLPIDTRKPVMIALQEIDCVWYDENQPLDIGQFLVSELGSHFTLHSSTVLDSQKQPNRRAWNAPIFEGALRATESIGIVTNLELASWPWSGSKPNYPGHGKLTALATQISSSSLYSSGDRDTQPRKLIVSSLNTPIGPVVFICCHLATLKNEDRRDQNHPITQKASLERQFQTRQILNIVEEIRGAEAGKAKSWPIILAGDFNAEPLSKEMLMLQTEFKLLDPESTSGNKWTHINHQVQIDHIFLSDKEQRLGNNIECYVYDNPGIRDVTDHFPVYAIVNLR